MPTTRFLRPILLLLAGVVCLGASITQAGASEVAVAPPDQADVVLRPMGPGPGARADQVTKDGYLLPPSPDDSTVPPTSPPPNDADRQLVETARSDYRNVDLNRALAAVDFAYVTMRRSPEIPQGWADLAVEFNLSAGPYSGPLDLFSDRPGGTSITGTGKDISRVTVLMRDGKVIGLEIQGIGGFVPDNPKDLPPDSSSTDSGD